MVLLGLAEFSEYVGVKKTTIHKKLSSQDNGVKVKRRLPEPVARLKATPVWTIEQAILYKRGE